MLNAQNWMSLADFDRDGRLDLLVTGQDHNPNFQIVFGGTGGFTAGTLVVLPDGPFGHVSGPVPDGTLTTTEVSPVVVADFNNDGMPDIFAVNRNITLFTTGCPTANPCRYDVGDSTYQVRLNRGSRNFVDVSPSPYVNLGRVEYQNLMTVDLNNDGFLDVVGTYTTDPPPGVSPQWGTTLFLNDGTGAFQLVDGAQFIGVTTTPPNGNRWGLGSFVPTVISPGRTEGIVYQTVGGCGTPGGCFTGLNLYKVVANGTLGTGPSFVDPATLGVPGFNEFFYLRHYPDAAAAVQSGQYANGLAHYLAVGQSRGYLPHAPSSGASGPVGLTSTVAGSTVTVTWQPPASAVPLSYVIEAGSSSGTANLAAFDIGSTATTLTVPNVLPGTYFVRVRARSAGGLSAPSNEIIITVGGSCTGAPGPPSGLVSSVSGSAVALSWQAPTVGCPTTAYVIEAGSSPGSSNLAAFSTGSPATTFATAASLSGIYYVRVRAANSSGASSPSNEVTVTVP